jgi:hypothetical protein
VGLTRWTDPGRAAGAAQVIAAKGVTASLRLDSGVMASGGMNLAWAAGPSDIDARIPGPPQPVVPGGYRSRNSSSVIASASAW